MPRVVYKTEVGLDMLGRLQINHMPACPVCGEWTYSEDTCPFCRMNGVLTELEYGDYKWPKRGDWDDN